MIKRTVAGLLMAVLSSLITLPIGLSEEEDGPPYKFTPTAETRYYKVTSLNDSGRGTLRECAQATGSRVCLFEVGGTIKLNSDIAIKSHSVLIAGQTSPYPGITITRAGISVRARNVEIEHLSIRPGDSSVGSNPSERNAMSIGAESSSGVYSVSLKNLSLTWAVDENFSTWYPATSNVWLRNSIVAEALNDSIHPKGPHSSGILNGFGTACITYEGNLIAFNFDRNPYVEPAGSAKFLNNVVYGWGGHGPWNIGNLTNNFDVTSPSIAAFIGNVWIPASYSFATDGSIYAFSIAPASKVYVRDNYGPGRPNDSYPETDIASLADPSALTTVCPFSSGCLASYPASNVEFYVLKNSGSRPKQRSSIDARIVNDVKNRGGSIKDCLKGCANSTGDIPSTGKTRRILTVPTNPTGDSDGDGISNFDEWLNIYTAEVEYL